MTYGNFAEPKAKTGSKRSEDVLLTALERCEQLEERLEACCRLVGKLNIKGANTLQTSIIGIKKTMNMLQKT